MTFVIAKTVPEKGCVYVALPGQAKSYTRSLAEAWSFPSRAAAASQKCGDERIIRIDR